MKVKVLDSLMRIVTAVSILAILIAILQASYCEKLKRRALRAEQEVAQASLLNRAASTQPQPVEVSVENH